MQEFEDQVQRIAEEIAAAPREEQIAMIKKALTEMWAAGVEAGSISAEFQQSTII